MKARLLALDEIPAAGALKLDFFGREALAYLHEGKPRVVLNHCQHLGGPLELKGDRFVCGWHGAEFSCANGLCQQGPAARDSKLIFLPTRIEDGALFYVYGE
ncbi:MAG TPA: Rieske 2Fe-2S domain-containing protein [Gammaproteobacteria bacterium]|nr:Rieske 2Fe-2S domain-containing protein [Gammaproteobacteria bacterium]